MSSLQKRFWIFLFLLILTVSICLFTDLVATHASSQEPSQFVVRDSLTVEGEPMWLLTPMHFPMVAVHIETPGKILAKGNILSCTASQTEIAKIQQNGREAKVLVTHLNCKDAQRERMDLTLQGFIF